MNKLLVLAALLGYTLAGPYDWWTEGVKTGQGWVINEYTYTSSYFNFDHFAEADFGFGTLYHGTAMYPQSSTAYTHVEQYGVHAYSYARESITL